MLQVFTENKKVLFLSLLSSVVFIYLAYFLDRSHFYELIGCFGICFGIYIYSVKKATTNALSLFLGLGILFRLLFLFSTPTLSDDYFRFIWDGQLILNSINPFDLLPTQVGIDLPNKADLLAGMNSPNYYTVYPPIAQSIYFLSAWLSPNSILGSIVVMRSIILATEIGTLLLLPKLLSKLNLNPKQSLWYVLNPLVIVELTGNLHFEGIVIFFFVLAVYLLMLQKEKLSSIAWAFAAATKLIPIFFLPIILRKLPFKKAFFFYLLFGISFLILWL
ncbi:MAG: mannosyltransferase, partial [Flavobacteriales bacterium]|nr:mannosyltransferase [Flavobacteriales bacterium]